MRYDQHTDYSAPHQKMPASTAIASALKSAGYDPARDQLYVAMQAFYGACDGKNFLAEVSALARQVAKDLSGQASTLREGDGHGPVADLGHRVVAIPGQASESQKTFAANGQMTGALRIPIEQDQSLAADRPHKSFPAQPNSMGHATNANSQRGFAHRTPNSGNGQPCPANGHITSAVAAVPKEPTANQIAAQVSIKATLAKSLFDRFWLGKSVGDWSYRGLVGVDRDGQFARALRDEIGEIAEGDKDRNVRELLGGDEKRLHKVISKCGRLRKA